MSNSAIYTVNQTATELAANSQIPLGGIIRHFGRCANLEGSNITLCSNGYYKVDVSITAEPTTAGPVSAQLYLNGMPYDGAQAETTVATAGDSANLSFTCLVRIMCGNASSIGLRLGEEGATVTNVACVVEKI